MIYNISGWPCSDELYHHGIIGQKWGVRRYQNPDGTLTIAGKIHYGTGKAVRAIGKAAVAPIKVVGRTAKKYANHKVTDFKRKHPWMLSDDELKIETERVKQENAYRAELRKKKEPISRGKKVAQDILESGAKTLSTKAFDKLANSLFARPETVRDLSEVLADSNATAQQIKNAKDRFDAEKALREYEFKNRRYDSVKPGDLDSMSRSELESYAAWRKARNSDSIAPPKPGNERQEKPPKPRNGNQGSGSEGVKNEPPKPENKERSQSFYPRKSEPSSVDREMAQRRAALIVNEGKEKRRVREETAREARARAEQASRIVSSGFTIPSFRVTNSSATNSGANWVRSSGALDTGFITLPDGTIIPLSDN